MDAACRQGAPGASVLTPVRRPGPLGDTRCGQPHAGDATAYGSRFSAPLAPLRQAVLEQLREPGSAAEVAARLGESRQRINYHVRELERGGLVELVEERRRRGCIERVVRATADAVVVEPTVVGRPAAQDRFAADTLIENGARLVRDVAAARRAAAERGQRLLTFAIEAEVGFEHPSELERFADALADRIAELAAESGPGRRRYRVIVGGHPA